VGRFDGKTEKATPRRRQEAKREGRMPRSQEVGVAVSLLGLFLALRVFGPNALEVLRRETVALLGAASGDRIPAAAVGSVGRMLLALVVPFLAVAVLAALVSGVGQTGFTLSPKAAKPKLSNISPKQGLRRLAPAKAGWELGRTVAKLGLLAAVVWGPLTASRQGTHARDGIDAGLEALVGQANTIFLRVLLLAALIGAADYAWARFTATRELRMSKEDVKEEAKQTEGDPLVKAQRRRRAQELSRNRMLREVAGADVVVTNPTHLAVALRYRDGEPAPRVVAKGADRLAAKIRKIAYRNGILVTEDKPLARALYRRCKVGAFIPGALYEAVAVVLAVAYRRYGGARVAAGTATSAATTPARASLTRSAA